MRSAHRVWAGSANEPGLSQVNKRNRPPPPGMTPRSLRTWAKHQPRGEAGRPRLGRVWQTGLLGLGCYMDSSRAFSPRPRGSYASCPPGQGEGTSLGGGVPCRCKRCLKGGRAWPVCGAVAGSAGSHGPSALWGQPVPLKVKHHSSRVLPVTDPVTPPRKRSPEPPGASFGNGVFAEVVQAPGGHGGEPQSNRNPSLPPGDLGTQRHLRTKAMNPRAGRGGDRAAQTAGAQAAPGAGENRFPCLSRPVCAWDTDGNPP